MEHLRNVEDVMTHAVVSADRGTAFKDIVQELLMWNVSALPVLAQDGRVIGVVAYLNGSLPDPAMEDIVVRAAGTVPGVVDVRADFAATEAAQTGTVP
ncbi:CBS domain-containing protein [Streptomyces virginiae]|uniref:CBS domain-containing protein n=1 Tax=Streptomyces virginiae TaxID=1961 RepID=UPI00363A49E4